MLCDMKKSSSSELQTLLPMALKSMAKYGLDSLWNKSTQMELLIRKKIVYTRP